MTEVNSLQLDWRKSVLTALPFRLSQRSGKGIAEKTPLPNPSNSSSTIVKERECLLPGCNPSRDVVLASVETTRPCYEGCWH